jgi:hypothetical protein
LELGWRGMLQNEVSWARDTFGGAQLGDRRRVERLVAVAAQVACRPKGTVTAALQTSAEQEGAFRLLESENVSAAIAVRLRFKRRYCVGPRPCVTGGAYLLRCRHGSAISSHCARGGAGCVPVARLAGLR